MNKYRVKIESRVEFLKLIDENNGLLIIKFGAGWCGPCRRIESEVHNFFDGITSAGRGNVTCANVDIDESMDVYSFLKSNRRVNGIPVIFCYVKGNHDSIIPTYSVTGADPNELYQFFNRCKYALSTI
jgi:thiol-disulfide isomerase/thioredoxin